MHLQSTTLLCHAIELLQWNGGKATSHEEEEEESRLVENLSPPGTSTDVVELWLFEEDGMSYE